jgi:hypothetical protein
VVDIDLAALSPADRVLPVQIITSGGAILWSLEIDALPEAGSFRGAVSFDAQGVSLASSAIILDLDFRDDGTIAGRIDTDASLLWPQPLALTGTWNVAGDISLVLRDRLPAEDWRYSPLARELGRELALTGKRTAAGLEGTALETITGLRAEPVQIQGAFALHRQGPLTGIVHAPDFIPKDAQPPTWLAPPGLDTEACDDLGDRYGTEPTLPEPSAACDACAAGFCAPEDMLDCGLDLRAAAYNLTPVLAALHGKGRREAPGRTVDMGRLHRRSPGVHRRRAGLPGHRRAALRPRPDPPRQPPDSRGPGARRWPIFRRSTPGTRRSPPTSWPPRPRSTSHSRSRTRSASPSPVPSRASWRSSPPIASDSPQRSPPRSRRPISTASHGSRTTDPTCRPPTPTSRPCSSPPTSPRPRRNGPGSRTGPAISRRTCARRSDSRRSPCTPRAPSCTPASEPTPRRRRACTRSAPPCKCSPRSTRNSHRARRPSATRRPTSRSRSARRTSPRAAATSTPCRRSPPTRSTQFVQTAADAWQKSRDYEQKTHTLAATALQIETEYDAKLRALCGSRPGETTPDLNLRRARRPDRRPPRRDHGRRSAHPPRHPGQREQPARDRGRG